MTGALLLAATAIMIHPAGRRRIGRQRDIRASALALSPWRIGAGLAAAVILAAAVTSPALGVASAIVAGTLGHRVRQRGRARRREAEVRALLAGLDVVVSDLRVGAHLEAACLGAAEESAGVCGEAFRSAAATARLGGSAARGLLTAVGSAERTDVGLDLQRVVAAWRIAETHGIALADLLDAARNDLAGRVRFRSRVDAGMAGARATAAVLAGLPVLGIALGELMGAEPLSVLLSGGLGGILLIVGTSLGCAGLAWTNRITGRVTA